MGKLLFLNDDQWDRIADPGEGPEDAVLREFEARRLRREVKRLPKLERQVIVWRFGLAGERLNIREVGRRLNVPRSTAHDIETRALRRLRDAYGDVRDAA